MVRRDPLSPSPFLLVVAMEILARLLEENARREVVSTSIIGVLRLISLIYVLQMTF